jgi:hypothetical protein
MKSRYFAVPVASLLAAGVNRVSLAQTVPPAPPDVHVNVQVQGLSGEEARRIHQDTRAALKKAQEEMKASGVAFPAAMATLQGMPSFDVLFAARDTRLDADFDNIPLRDALSRLFAAAKQDFAIESDVNASTKVLLKAKNIRLISALQALTDQAGVGWTTVILRRKDDMQFRSQFRIVQPAAVVPAMPMPGASIYSQRLPTAMSDQPGQNLRGTTWTFNTAELRQTFTCPHCKGRITTVRPRSQRDSQAAWRFCPLCGKPVDMEEDDDEHTAIGRIEPGSRLHIQVVSDADDKDYDGNYSVDSNGMLRFRTYPIQVHVIGFTTGQLEKVLAARLRTWLKEPKVNATLISHK